MAHSTHNAPPPGRRLARCIATARSGNRCLSAPLDGKKFCAMHTPGMAAKLGQKGGRRRAIFNPENLAKFAPPKTASELRDLLGATLIEVREGRMDVKVGNALGAIGMSFLKSVEAGDFDERLKVLETWKHEHSPKD